MLQKRKCRKSFQKTLGLPPFLVGMEVPKKPFLENSM